MNHQDREKEAISALMDGELSPDEIDSLIGRLQSGTLKDDWDVYHALGDALRSDDLNVPMSANFNQKFAERFAAEPVMIARGEPRESSHGLNEKRARYLWGFGGAVAAMLMVAVIMPKMTGSDAGRPGNQLAARNGFQLASAKTDSSPASLNSPEEPVSKPDQLDMLRDPRIDSYLVAHQRFSPTISKATVVNPPAQEK